MVINTRGHEVWCSEFTVVGVRKPKIYEHQNRKR